MSQDNAPQEASQDDVTQDDATQLSHPFNIEECYEFQECRSRILTPMKEHRYSLIWLHKFGESAQESSAYFLDPRWNFVPDNCKVLCLTPPERQELDKA